MVLSIWWIGPAPVEARETCISALLHGLPQTVRAGQRVHLSAELDSGCNYKVIDVATLVCTFPDGAESRVPLEPPGEGSAQVEIELEIPTLEGGGAAECLIEFSQCNETHRTCAVSTWIESPSLPDGARQTPEPPTWPVPPAPGSPRVTARAPGPPPAPARRPARTVGAAGGRFLRGLGWIGVAVGLGLYADAGSKEQEGKTDEAQESEDLATQVLGAGSVLLLLGYAIDGSGYVAEPGEVPRRRVQPALSIDPFHRAVLLHVSVRFD